MLAPDPPCAFLDPATMSALAAVFSALAAAVAIVVSVRALKIQRAHNVLSLKPLPMVQTEDFEEKVAITLWNHGPGPMIVTSIRVSGAGQAAEALVDCMPKPVLWTTFIGPIDQTRSVAANDSVVLLQLDGEWADPAFAKDREEVRSALAKLTVTIHYTDVYGSPSQTMTKQLEWFKREKRTPSHATTAAPT